MDYTRPFVRVSVSGNTGGMDYSSLARAVAQRWYRLRHGNETHGMEKTRNRGPWCVAGLMSLSYWLTVSCKELTQLEYDKSDLARYIEINCCRCRNLYLSGFVHGQYSIGTVIRKLPGIAVLHKAWNIHTLLIVRWQSVGSCISITLVLHNILPN